MVLRSGVPDRSEGRNAALLESLDDGPGDRLVRDADDRLGSELDCDAVSEPEHVGLPPFIGVPYHGVGLSGEDLADQTVAVGSRGVAGDPHQSAVVAGLQQVTQCGTDATPGRDEHDPAEQSPDVCDTDGRQAAWTVAFLCAGQKTDDGKIVVFDNAANKASGKWKANAPDFTISEAGAKAYGLGGERIGLWLSDAPKNIQAGDGSFHPFSEEDMHTRCGV